MTCNNCKGSWSPPPHVVLDACPFCKAPTPFSLGVLKEILEKHGKDCYKDPAGFSDLLANFLPNEEKKTLNLLQILLAYHASEILYKKHYLPVVDFEKERVALITSLSEKTSIDTETAEKGVNILCQGLGIIPNVTFRSVSGGDFEAQSQQGLANKKGNGLPQKDQQVFQLLETAEKQGDGRTQFQLGVCNFHGIGVEKNEPLGSQWFQKAAEQGHPEAQEKFASCCLLGIGVEKNEALALHWFEKAGEQGRPEAQFFLGDWYDNASGRRDDEARAAHWYEKAAEQGHPKAQFCLGFLYEMGYGRENRDSIAVQWYEKAAEQGHANAQFYLGFCYSNGKGVAKNKEFATHWYQKAAKQGHEIAIVALKGEDVAGESKA